MSSPCRCRAVERAAPVDAGTPRKLIVCIDGTLNQFGERNSNVVEFYSHIDKSPGSRQLTYYNSGVGTYVGPSKFRFLSAFWKAVDNLLDMAFATHFKKIVLSAYRWISDHYEDGDEIYLFGFSRGAYQVRTIAGMIQIVGLINAGNQEQIPFAYALYSRAAPTKMQMDRLEQEDRPSRSNLRRFLDTLFKGLSTAKPDNSSAHRNSDAETAADVFKRTFSRPNANVHFVGVWDTVSSVGISRRMLPLTESYEHICRFRQALALDETRAKFEPECIFAVGGGSHMAPRGEPEPANPQVKEVWFPGSHSDVGGGNELNPRLDLLRPALLWMRHEAISGGLLFRPLPPHFWKEDQTTPMKIERSLSGFWVAVEILVRLFHFGQGRTIYDGQKIHISVLSNAYPENSEPMAKFKSSDVHSWTKYLGAEARGRLNYRDLDRIWDATLIANEDLAHLVSYILKADHDDRDRLCQRLWEIADTRRDDAISYVQEVILHLCREPNHQSSELLLKLSNTGGGEVSKKALSTILDDVRLLMSLDPVMRHSESGMGSNSHDLDDGRKEQDAVRKAVVDMYLQLFRAANLSMRTAGVHGLSALLDNKCDIRPAIRKANMTPSFEKGREHPNLREQCERILSSLSQPAPTNRGFSPPRPVNVLSIDGGGVRGLSPLLILRHLMERLAFTTASKVRSRPCEVFDLICGTSTGGLIAIMLGRLRMSVDEAIRSYLDISKAVFGNKAVGQNNKNGFVPMYDASVLEACVKKLVANISPDHDPSAALEDPLNEHDILCRTLVVAITQSFGDAPPKRFRSYPTDATFADTCAIWEAARATTAMRPFFPSIAVGEPPVQYIDGAFSGANNPSELAIDEALDIFSDRTIGCLISLGAGIPDVVQVTGEQAKLSEAYQKLLISCERVHEAVGKKSQRNDQPYFRFSVDRGLGNIAFDEWNRTEELAAITAAYMRGFEAQYVAVRCVEVLRTRYADG